MKYFSPFLHLYLSIRIWFFPHQYVVRMLRIEQKKTCKYCKSLSFFFVRTIPNKRIYKCQLPIRSHLNHFKVILNPWMRFWNIFFPPRWSGIDAWKKVITLAEGLTLTSSLNEFFFHLILFFLLLCSLLYFWL